MFRSGQRTDRRQRGLTLLEMGLSLFTAGVILSAVMVATGSSGSRTASAEAAYFDAIVDALLVFARRNHRLPCPDVNGDGEEDIECPPLVRAGGVPYTTLGIELAVPVGEGVDVKYVYGVYRGGGDVTRDLTRRAERSQPQPHPAGTARFEDGDDFRQALINAFRAPLTQADALVVSRQATVPLQCNSQAVNNVAFVVAFAGVEDRNGSGSLFDGPHLQIGGWSPQTRWSSVTANTCYASPVREPSQAYDDQIRAMAFLQLLGFLSEKG